MTCTACLGLPSFVCTAAVVWVFVITPVCLLAFLLLMARVRFEEDRWND